ncbi:MAG: hypothetical protein BAJALOKI2v1_10051 [Promethearchaeota archaeon]|nr:MAG: hypothetical protein BAJALOKI2v1_10051 [Candidatus Lokiarchaeota archaeon]
MKLSESLMMEFAENTGLNSDQKPRRYLWTDAFAVCNFIQLYKDTQNNTYKQLAVDLVDQVHEILGKHREDDKREGWLGSKEHPTKNGLRIGKSMPERKKGEPIDHQIEWERDGQYFHYLTKWMIALVKLGNILEDNKYVSYAVELIEASKRFIYNRRMYWKMSIDLSRPLVSSMGQHDPLNGYVTYKVVDLYTKNSLKDSIKIMYDIAKTIQLPTTDTLGIGELLVDCYRLYQINEDHKFIPKILDAIDYGLEIVDIKNHGLAFRELGLAIGLEGARRMNIFKSDWDKKDQIIDYWINHRNWSDSKDINLVMLVTSLISTEYLNV